MRLEDARRAGPGAVEGRSAHDAVPRVLALAAVAALHVLLLLFLVSGGTLVQVQRSMQPARLILEIRRPPPPPPRVAAPRLAAPPAEFLPVPDIQIASQPPRQPAAITPMHRTTAPPASHFGAATDAGLGLDVGTVSGGGAAARGTLASFEAAVRRAVLARKHQPALAWDRRNTCVVNYLVRVDRTGGVAGLHIDPCAVAEINEAARAAIEGAAPFPHPPDLGAASYEVHGALIFRP